MSITGIGLTISGLFSVVLGGLHFFVPIVFDFKSAIFSDSQDLNKIPLVGYRVQNKDVYGLTWVMNYAVSYTLVTIGVVDLIFPFWIHSAVSNWVLGWIAVWWFIRSGTQLYLGTRRGDLWIMSGFMIVGLFHMYCIVQ